MFRFAWLAVLAALFSLHSRPAAAQEESFDSMMRRVPGWANVVVLINARAAYDSPIGQREGWGRHDEDAPGRPIMLPPGADRVLLAALYDPRHQQTDWQVGVLEMAEAVSLPTIAASEGGYVDQVGGVDCAWSPRDAYFIELGPQTLGVLFPGIRQLVSRWVQYSDGHAESQAAAYLQQAASYTDSAGTEIIMAMDLRDISPAHTVRDHVEKSATLEGKTADLDAISAVLSSLQGVTLGVQTGEKLSAKIKVDFDRDVAPLAPFAKPLLLEAVANAGLMLDEFSSWKATASGKQITLGGELSTTGLRRLLSLVEPPAPAATAASAVAVAPPPPTETPTETEVQSPGEAAAVTAAATAKHYHSVEHMIDDLKDQSQDAKTLGQIAAFMDSYARKIDRLPLLGVDPDLLAFSAEASERLRVMANTVRRGTIDSSTAEKQIYGGYGDYGRRDQANARIAAGAIETGESAKDVREQAADLNNRLAAIRSEMIGKYGVDF